MVKQPTRIEVARADPSPTTNDMHASGLSMVSEVRHLNVDEVLKRSIPKASQTPIEGNKKKKESGSVAVELSSSVKATRSMKPLDRSKKRSVARFFAFFFR